MTACDVAFAPGTLHGAVTPQLDGVVPPPGLLTMLLLLAIGGTGVLSIAAFCCRMDGTLMLTGYGEETREIRLGPWPLLLRRTRSLTGEAGVLLISGSPGGRYMWVWLRLAQRSDSRALAPGGRFNLVGLDIAHTCAAAKADADGRR
jgi:hypothetical protein